jgi:hypothetical protein
MTRNTLTKTYFHVHSTTSKHTNTLTHQHPHYFTPHTHFLSSKNTKYKNTLTDIIFITDTLVNTTNETFLQTLILTYTHTQLAYITIDSALQNHVNTHN